MKLEVVQYPDPRLKRVCEPVGEITPEIWKLAEDMAETMYENDGIGLAAPQVGQNIRMIVVDLSGPSERAGYQAYVNPTLTPLPDDETGEQELLESEEGCLSVPEGYRSKVKRHSKVRVSAIGLDGQPIEKDCVELEAICLQHECDHLDGKLFIDRISRLKRNLYDSKLKKKAREAEQG